MSLPPGFLDELRTRVTLSAIVGRTVTWDMRKSNMAKGDWWAPCPFHQERTASFHVDDRKGFYYCFGCHAKGDVLTFLKENGKMAFIEAVEVLAREAGMTMPARDPKAADRADRRTELAQVMEEAVKLYKLQLRTQGAAAARDYLKKRRLSEATQEKWDLGFAPNSRTFLLQALQAKGIAPPLIEAAGLVAKADDGTFYDRFRGRIIFPIRDARGRAISLGGRAMDPNAQAKYLNGPETELFDKGRNLFNIGPARDAAGKGQPLIVAEGYMDVIALCDAGFGATVAPLGTAVTEDQLRLMWRIHPEPIIALDGDKAGLRAALRVVDLALPMLEAGQGLRFAILPEGQDPDDLIRGQGAAAMQGVLDRAEPMVTLLWRRETEGKLFDSPERKAALDKTLRAAIARIADPSIRGHYGEEIRRLRLDLFGQDQRQRPWVTPRFRPGRGGPPAQVAPTEGARASALASRGEAVEEATLEAVLLATLAQHPRLLPEFETDLETVELHGEGFDTLRLGLLAAREGAMLEDAARTVLENLLKQRQVRSAPPVHKPADTDLARSCVAEGFAKLAARRGWRAEVAEAMVEMDGLVDEGLTWRLAQSSTTRNEAERTRLPDADDLGEDRNALSKGLQDMIDAEIWIKRRPDRFPRT
jgi:DNA primase